MLYLLCSTLGSVQLLHSHHSYLCFSGIQFAKCFVNSLERRCQIKCKNRHKESQKSPATLQYGSPNRQRADVAGSYYFFFTPLGSDNILGVGLNGSWAGRGKQPEHSALWLCLRQCMNPGDKASWFKLEQPPQRCLRLRIRVLTSSLIPAPCCGVQQKMSTVEYQTLNSCILHWEKAHYWLSLPILAFVNVDKEQRQNPTGEKHILPWNLCGTEFGIS